VELRHQRHPREHRHAHHSHARRTEVDDRYEEVDAGRDGGNTKNQEAEDPEVDVEAGRILGRRQIGVPKPARVWRGTHEEARVHEKAADQEHPEAEGVQAWKGNISRTNLQGNDVVEERSRQRHDGKEHHRRPVHREELIEHLRTDEIVIGRRKLRANKERLESPQQEKTECGDAIQNTDPLVIGGRDPTPQCAGR